MPKPDRKMTMKDIAGLAGVSAMTVSAALSGKPGVSEKTRKRIREIAAALNYTPNPLARSFREDRTNTVGVILSSSFETVFAMIFKGIEEVAKQEGLGVLVATAEDDLEHEINAIRMIAGKRVDGIILTSTLQFDAGQKSLVDQFGIPYVLTVRSCKDKSVTTVLNDNYHGAYTMVDHLARTGSKRILFIALEKRRSSSAERIRGWKDALAAHGMEMSPKLLDYAPPWIESGYLMMRERIRRGVDWDTVVCGCDTIAIGVMKACREAGIDIPGQLRITGYDGIPLVDYLQVPLTTMQQPLHEVGATAMRLLQKKISDAASPAQQIYIKSTLVIRCSS